MSFYLDFFFFLLQPFYHPKSFFFLSGGTIFPVFVGCCPVPHGQLHTPFHGCCKRTVAVSSVAIKCLAINSWAEKATAQMQRGSSQRDWGLLWRDQLKNRTTNILKVWWWGMVLLERKHWELLSSMSCSLSRGLGLDDSRGRAKGLAVKTMPAKRRVGSLGSITFKHCGLRTRI